MIDPQHISIRIPLFPLPLSSEQNNERFKLNQNGTAFLMFIHTTPLRHSFFISLLAAIGAEEV